MKKSLKLLIIILALSLSNAYSQKRVNLPQKGTLAKSNIQIYGANIDYLEIYYSITGTAVGPTMSNLQAGAPMIAGSYKWIAGQDTKPEFLLGICEPDIYIQLKYIEPSTRREFLGYTKLIFFGGGAPSGKDFVNGGHGEAGEAKGYATLLMTLPGNFQYLNAQTAKTIWSYGYVSDFFVVNNSKIQCVNWHKIHLAQIAKQRKEKEDLQQNYKLQNEKSRLQIVEIVKQLPSNDQQYFQGRLSDIIQLAPQYQQKAYDRLQNDLLTKTSEIEDQNVRKAALQIKRTEQESNLNKQLSEVNNPKDRAELGNRLAELKQSKSITIDMEYAQLESDIRKALESEKRVNQEIAEFKNTYETQNSDFKSRSGAMQTNGEMNRIMDDPSLRSEEKERQILQKQIQLNNNISVYNDDTQKIDQQKAEISEIESQNQANAGLAIGLLAILASVLTLGAIGQEVGEGHVWSHESKRHPSFYVGASAMAVPLVANYNYWNEYNDGMLTSGAKTTTQQTTGHKVVVSTGIGAGFQNEFLLGEKAGLGLFAEAGYHFINVEDAMSAIVGIVGGDVSASTTNYDDATTATTSKTNLLYYGGGINGYVGAYNRPKLLWEASIGQYTGTHNYTYKYQYTGSAGNYSNVDTFHSGSIGYQMFRTWIGCRFGDMSSADAVLLDIKAGKEFTNNINFSKSSPWLLQVSMHKPHRFRFSIIGSYGYFEEASVSFSNKFNIGLKLARSFDWYK